MGKFFNIAGPCNPERHYMLPATARVPEVMRFIEDEAYFVVHAQRQCGKTTAFRTRSFETVGGEDLVRRSRPRRQNNTRDPLLMIMQQW